LNDDDALELFKKTLPSSSLLQVGLRANGLKQRALAAMGVYNDQSPLAFVSLALRGRSKGFEKVIAMIDDMKALLSKEQADDAAHKSYCEAEIETTEDTLKSLNIKISDLGVASDELKSMLARLAEDLASLTEDVKTLDGQVAEASEQRKAEHQEFVDTTAANNAAVELLRLAKNRLNQFYQKKLATTTPAAELAADEQIVANFGGTAPPTPAPGGIAGTGISPAFVQRSSVSEAPGKEPETWTKYEKKGQESTGVIAMIDLLIADLTKEVTTMGVEEKKNQADYEGLMQESAQKRAADMKSIATKESEKADAEALLQKTSGEVAETKNAAFAKTEMLGALHADCDWLLKHFNGRKEARAKEIESLTRAKDVLSGADYSLLQINAGTRALRKYQSPEDTLAKEMTHDLEMNFNKIAPFGKEDTAKELQDHASKTQDTLVDAVENAEVAEIKRAVFRALTRLRAATIKEFDTIARLETQAIDAYNDAHHYRAENPLAHLHEDEAPVETDKLKSFH